MGFAACPCRSLSTCRRPPVPSHAACQRAAWSRRQFFRAFAERRRSTMCPSCDIVPWEIGRSTRTVEQLSSCCARFVVSSCPFGHIGHARGGMIAAEMACIAPHDPAKLVLVSPAGLWIDEHPIPDIFALLPYQIAEVLFHDPQQGQALLTGGADLSDMEALKEFYIGSQRRLAMAGKILFPIPNRRLSKRLYRLTAETLILWGASDRLIVPAYAERWKTLIPHARVEVIGDAGHMVPYEQSDKLVRSVAGFLG